MKFLTTGFMKVLTYLHTETVTLFYPYLRGKILKHPLKTLGTRKLKFLADSFNNFHGSTQVDEARVSCVLHDQLYR